MIGGTNPLDSLSNTKRVLHIGVPEWLNGAVSKTVSESSRGFKSYHLCNVHDMGASPLHEHYKQLAPSAVAYPEVHTNVLVGAIFGDVSEGSKETVCKTVREISS